MKPRKRIATLALMLHFGAAGVYAQQRPVKSTFSGNVATSTISLAPNTDTDEQNLAGNGTLGPFTFRELHADPITPQASSACSGPTKLFFPNVVGGGLFRFEDGSLLTVAVTVLGSSICIDLTAGVAHLTTNYQITGGTGRFKGASGMLTLTALLTPVLFDASNRVVLATDTGELTGTLFGGAKEEERQDGRQ